MAALEDNPSAMPETGETLKANKLSKSFRILAIAFAATVVGLVVTFVIAWTLIPRYRRAPPLQNVCHSHACIKVSDLLLRNVDLSVDPCHDFYSFACGRVMKRPYSPETIKFGLGNFMSERTSLSSQMFELFYNADLVRSDDPEMNQMYEAIRLIFVSCVGWHDPYIWWLQDKPEPHVWNNTNKFDLRVIAEPLAKLLDGASTAEEFVALLTRTQTSGLLRLYQRNKDFFRYGQPKSGNQRHLMLTGMDFNFKSRWDRAAYYEIAQLMQELGINITHGTDDMVSKQNMIFHLNTTDLFNVTLKELQSETEKSVKFNWTHFLVYLDYSLTGPEEFVQFHRFNDFIEVLKELLPEVAAKRGPLYDLLRFDAAMTLRLFYKKKFPNLSRLYTGTKVFVNSQEGIDKYDSFVSVCVDMAQKSLVPVAFEMFEKAYITDSFSLIHSMVSELQFAMKQNVDSESWIMSKSKQIIKDRIDAIKRRISYLHSPTAKIKTMFRQSMKIFNRSKTFGDLVLFYQDATFRQKLWTMTSKAPGDEKIMALLNPFLVNAMYARDAHSIYIITGILGTYLYNKDYPEYLLYGGIGTVIGHEIAHAFDVTSFSSITIPSDENETLLRYEENSNCLVDTYSQMMMAPNSTRVNGSYTVGENFADIVGINAAFKAYKNMVSAHQKPLQLLPGPLGSRLSPDQLFFVQAVQFWCRRQEKNILVKHYVFDRHSPPKARVLGFTRHSKDFSKVFQCKPGDGMYLSDSIKCHNW